MRAAVIEAPGVLKIWDIPQPVPGEYDALCENLYGATCTGTDTHLIRNTFPWGCTYPAILGHESIGRVIECGSKVRNLRVGDLVTRVSAPADPTIGLSVSWGGFAQYGIARDHWAMRADGRQAQPLEFVQTESGHSTKLRPRSRHHDNHVERDSELRQSDEDTQRKQSLSSRHGGKWAVNRKSGSQRRGAGGSGGRIHGKKRGCDEGWSHRLPRLQEHGA